MPDETTPPPALSVEEARDNLYEALEDLDRFAPDGIALIGYVQARDNLADAIRAESAEALRAATERAERLEEALGAGDSRAR